MRQTALHCRQRDVHTRFFKLIRARRRFRLLHRVVIDALRSKYSLSELLSRLFLPRSSYYLRKTVRRRKDKYYELKKRITEIFTENRDAYGYRRVKAELEKSELFVSEKVIRRLMKKMNLTVQHSRRAKYNSYKGEISPAVENMIKRD